MDANQAVTVLTPNHVSIVSRDADAHRMGALLLSVLDRTATTAGPTIGRIIVYGRRVVVFDIAMPYVWIQDLVEHPQFGQRLSRRMAPQMIVIRPKSERGIQVIIDLGGELPAPRRNRSRLVWCAACAKLMSCDHTLTTHRS